MFANKKIDENEYKSHCKQDFIFLKKEQKVKLNNFSNDKLKFNLQNRTSNGLVLFTFNENCSVD